MSTVSVSVGFRSSPQHASYPVVTITAIQTETLRPTWVFTLPGSVTSSAPNGTLSTPTLSVLTNMSTWLSSDNAEPTTSSTSSMETLAPTRSPMTSLSIPMETQPSSTAESPSTTSSIMYIAPPLGSSTRLTSMIKTTPLSATSSVSLTSLTSSTIPLTTSTPSPTKTPPLIGVPNASTSSTSANSPSTKTNILVGSIIGGCAVLIFLFALAFCIRRKSPDRSINIKQHLLRPSISSRHSSPTFPTLSTPPPPPPPPIPIAYSNPDLSLDSMYLRREQARFQPSGTSSRMASFYSTSSWDGGLGLQEYWDLERGLAKHDSMRSNPFDLEPPPSVHRPPVLVPVPTPWGVKF